MFSVSVGTKKISTTILSLNFPYCCSLPQLCPNICDTMDCSTSGFTVLHCLPEFAQTHVHWVDDAIQPSHPVTPSSSCPQSFPASGLLQWWLFASGDQSFEASQSVLPTNIQGWFPLGLTGLISLLLKGLSRVFSSTTVQRHLFFGTQLSSLWINFPKFTRLNILPKTMISAFC